MNGFIDLIIIYGVLILLSPMLVIACINGFLSEIKKKKDIEWTHGLYLDFTFKSYFCILVMILAGFWL